MPKYLVEFPSQYQNAAQVRVCSMDSFGSWNLDGCPMPPPKVIMNGSNVRLICAPSSIVDAMR